MPSIMPSATPSSGSSTASTQYKKDEKYQPTYNQCHLNGGGVASVVLSCCAPEFRASPVNNNNGNSGAVRGSNVWSEKEYGKQTSRSSTEQAQNRQYPILGCGQPGSGNRPPKPFASTTLLDKNDSLVQEGSLLSLVASDCETRSYDEFPSTPQITTRQGRKPKPFESSPLLDRDDSLVQGGSLLSLIASQDENNREENIVPSTPQISYARYDHRFLQTPSTDGSSFSLPSIGLMPPPPSPAMELSMAKREASAQLMGGKLMRRELSRGSLFPKVNSVVSVSSVQKGMKEMNVGQNGESEKEDNEGRSKERISVFDCLSKVDPPNTWGEEDNIHSELKSTYRYNRLFARDPFEEGGNDGGSLWWIELGKRMDTTLSHVFHPHWQEYVQRNAIGNTSADTEENKSGQMILNDTTCSPDAIVDLCSNSTPQRLRQIPYQRQTSNTFHKTSLPNLSDISPVNAWSEPCASTMKIRGTTYAKDGIKVESANTIFACLGVDSFVNGDGSKDINSNSTHYLERWKKLCEEVGLSKPPFLLIINFVVPWGNFQSYSFRPDADNGPYSTIHRDRPSEKAWRSFMEGSTEQRNKVLKLIPRVCAGPWVVKKMVGSTPALVGTKLPVSYRGSIQENFLEVTLDVTKGPAFGNSVATTTVGKSDLVTVDLGFVIEGQEEDGTLPEQMLSLIRLHHLEMKKAFTIRQWGEEVDRRQKMR